MMNDAVLMAVPCAGVNILPCVPGVSLYSSDEEQVCRHRHILKRILQPDDGPSQAEYKLGM